MASNVQRCAVKFLREPIIHFLIIGVVIFGLYEARNDKATPEPDNRITVTAGDVERTLTGAGGELVATVRLFDVYRGEQVGEGRRSLAFAVRLQAADRTLTDEDVADVRRRLIDAVEGALPATLRG